MSEKESPAVTFTIQRLHESEPVTLYDLKRFIAMLDRNGVNVSSVVHLFSNMLKVVTPVDSYDPEGMLEEYKEPKTFAEQIEETFTPARMDGGARIDPLIGWEAAWNTFRSRWIRDGGTDRQLRKSSFQAGWLAAKRDS